MIEVFIIEIELKLNWNWILYNCKLYNRYFDLNVPHNELYYRKLMYFLLRKFLLSLIY